MTGGQLLVWLTIGMLGLVAWAHTRRNDGRTPPVRDCGRDGCTFRGRVVHRHKDGPRTWP